MATISAPSDIVEFPASPQSVEEAGLPLDLILQLALKSLHFSGELSGTELSQRLGLDFHVIQPALDLLKVQQQISIVGGGFVAKVEGKRGVGSAGGRRCRDSPLLESAERVCLAGE